MRGEAGVVAPVNSSPTKQEEANDGAHGEHGEHDKPHLAHQGIAHTFHSFPVVFQLENVGNLAWSLGGN